jgi:hypothetical protein
VSIFYCYAECRVAVLRFLYNSKHCGSICLLAESDKATLIVFQYVVLAFESNFVTVSRAAAEEEEQNSRSGCPSYKTVLLCRWRWGKYAGVYVSGKSYRAILVLGDDANYGAPLGRPR